MGWSVIGAATVFLDLHGAWQGLPDGPLALWLGAASAVFVVARNHTTLRELWRLLAVEEPRDGVLRDVGWAGLEALDELALVSLHLDHRAIRVRAVRDGSLEVVLDQARGQLAYTRSEVGWRALLRARSQLPRRARSYALDRRP